MSLWAATTTGERLALLGSLLGAAGEAVAVFRGQLLAIGVCGFLSAYLATLVWLSLTRAKGMGL